jgi:DNA-binding response OmpR family regulator
MTRVCVIGESDPFVAQLLQRFAEESGLPSFRAQIGPEVLDLVRQVKPRVLILEPELPGAIRGWEVAQTLAADPGFSALPIIACSWLSVADANALLGHVAGYLRKPELHYEDFVAALREAGVKMGARLNSMEAAPYSDKEA